MKKIFICFLSLFLLGVSNSNAQYSVKQLERMRAEKANKERVNTSKENRVNKKGPSYYYKGQKLNVGEPLIDDKEVYIMDSDEMAKRNIPSCNASGDGDRPRLKRKHSKKTRKRY